MVKSLLKYQLRQGLFLIPLIIVPLYFLTHNYIIVFLLLQNRFFNMFQQNDFHLPMLHVTGADLNNLLKTYNLSWTIWFNGWFIVAQTINLIWLKIPFQESMVHFINFNSILFTSFIVGNLLSNSDLITVKNSIFRYLALSFIFSFSISTVYSISLLINYFQQTFWVDTFLLIVIIQAWNYSITKHIRIKHITYYL